MRIRYLGFVPTVECVRLVNELRKRRPELDVLCHVYDKHGPMYWSLYIDWTREAK